MTVNPADKQEHLSQGFTGANNGKATMSVGGSLFSNNDDTRMLTVGEDTVGVHGLEQVTDPCNVFMSTAIEVLSPRHQSEKRDAGR